MKGETETATTCENTNLYFNAEDKSFAVYII